jgi:hypothetical protein
MSGKLILKDVSETWKLCDIFPEPVVDGCEDCRTRTEQERSPFQLRVCQHRLERLLHDSGRYKEVLRAEKLKWHPDRFCRVAESVMRRK